MTGLRCLQTSYKTHFMLPVIENAIQSVRCWWRTPAPNFPARFPLRGCAAPENVWFPDEGIDDADSTVPPEERTNRSILEHGIDTGNFDMLIVNVTKTGFLGTFDVNGDGISLISRAMDQSGNVIESSRTARLYIRVNSERALAMPFSLTLDPNGPQKSDLLSLAARVQRIWVYCDFPTQDAVNEPSIVIVFTKGVAVSGLFGSSGSASFVPASPSGGADAAGVGGVSGGGGISGGGGPGSGGGGRGGGGQKL